MTTPHRTGNANPEAPEMSANPTPTCDNESGPGGVGSTSRGLTHLSDSAGRGLGVSLPTETTDPAPTPVDGASLIAAERRRQVEAEGWTPEHDAGLGDGSLAMAAVCYALPPTERRPRHVFSFWPWHSSWWKPTPDDRVRELVKAGALVAAEIDRLQAQQ